MNNSQGTSSVSIVLDKINIEEYGEKLSDSFEKNIGYNDIDNNDEMLSTDDNQNSILIDDLSGIELDKINPELNVKPIHWTNEYWQEIITKFPWFMHKDNFIGCKICYNIKVFMGKKSLLATMKLYLMDLSYADLELKLSAHRITTQHNKSIILYKAKLNNTEVNLDDFMQTKPVSTSLNNIIKRSRSIEHHCPLCNKGYKIKKALANHIYSCNNEMNNISISLPCKCQDDNIVSIRAIDEHNIKCHASSLLYVCKFCDSEFKQTTVLFGHLLIFHDFYWNPYEELPNIIENSKIHENITTTMSNRPERKKSILNSRPDDIYIRYGAKDKNINFTNTKQVMMRKPYRKRQLSRPEPETPTSIPLSEIRIERVMSEVNKQEISKLTISQNNIFMCEYCGGRYLSMGILNDHMAFYHPIVSKKELVEEEKIQEECRKRLNKLVNSTNLKYQATKTVKSTYIRLSNHMRKVRALQMKKKFNLTENKAKINEEMQKKTKPKDIKLLIAKRNKVSASMLTCPTCHQSFDNLDLRSEHVSLYHPELEKFSCKICGLIFSNQTNYRRHLEKSHNNLLPKKAKATPEKTYSCDKCHLVFTNQADLSRHSSFSHPEKQNEVQNLRSDFPKCDLDEMEPMEYEDEFANTMEGEIVEEAPNELELLIKTDSKESSSCCELCETVLHNPFELLIHSYIHNETGHDDEDFQICPHCSRLFFGKNRKMYLKDHYSNEHLNKPSAQCAVCKTIFSSSFVLEKHLAANDCQLVDIDEPYLTLMAVDKLAFCCANCAMIFAGQDSLQRFDTHTTKCSLDLMDNELLDS